MSGNFRKKKIALAGALMFVVTSVSAQTVKGVVTDNTGEPIIGASVMEVGVAGNGGVTDLDGNFTVNLKGKSKKLKISYIGMKAKEVSVAGKESIDVKLEDMVRETKKAPFLTVALMNGGFATCFFSERRPLSM